MLPETLLQHLIVGEAGAAAEAIIAEAEEAGPKRACHTGESVPERVLAEDEDFDEQIALLRADRSIDTPVPSIYRAIRENDFGFWVSTDEVFGEGSAGKVGYDLQEKST